MCTKQHYDTEIKENYFEMYTKQISKHHITRIPTYLYVHCLVMFISYYVCLKCRGRVVTNVVRTCDPTPLLYIFGNIICLN